MRMNFQTREQKILLGMFVVVLAWGALLAVREDTTTIFNYLYNIAYSGLYLFGAVVAGTATMRSGKGSLIKKALGLFSIGLLGQTIALWMWTYYNIILQIERPYPALFDLFYLLLVPTLLASFYYIFRIYGVQIKRSMFRELFAVFALAALSVFFFITPPEISAHLSFATNAVNIIYPLSDVILLLVAFFLYRISGGTFQKSFTFFSLALLLQTMGDFAFSYRASRDLYWNGDVSDVLFAIAAFLFSYGMILLVQSLPEKQNQ